MAINTTDAGTIEFVNTNVTYTQLNLVQTCSFSFKDTSAGQSFAFGQKGG